jgi:hypothetical protein
METQKQCLYDAPAVVYEATLVAHAGPSNTVNPCTLTGGDLLDPSKNP